MNKSVLSKTEYSFATLISNIPGMVYRAKPDWSTEIISKGYRLSGYTNSEFESQKINWTEIIHPKDKRRVLNECKLLKKGHQSIIQTYRILDKGNKVRWVEDHKTSLFSEKGVFEGIDGIVFDITERKKTEEELKNIFNLSPDMLCVCVPEGKFVKVNPACERVLGYTTDEILELGWAKFLHPDDVENTNEKVARQLEGSSVANFINRFRCKDGTYKTLEWQATPAIEGIVYAAARDITERKKTEEQLQEQKVALEQKNIALREMLEQIQIEKNRIKEDVAINVDELLLPIVEKLRMRGSSKYAKLLQHHLKALTSSFGRKISKKNIKLSPRETEICNMVKGGLTSKEISGLLNISCQTIEKHRKNIRKKLGITNKSINLLSYLTSL